MSVLYLSELPVDSELHKLAKYEIGDRMRIVRVKLGEHTPEDLLAAARAVTGRVLSIKEVEFWETGNPDNPYWVTYSFYMAHLRGEPNRRSYLESLYLDEDEIVPVKKRKKK